MPKEMKNKYVRKKYSKYGEFHIHKSCTVNDLIKLKGSPSILRDRIIIYDDATLFVYAGELISLRSFDTIYKKSRK